MSAFIQSDTLNHFDVFFNQCSVASHEPPVHLQGDGLDYF